MCSSNKRLHADAPLYTIGPVSMQLELSVKMDAQRKPNNAPAFQVEAFDPDRLDSLIIKQIQGAIDSIKVIHSCLKLYFHGQAHMYKPISSQLRILFCDTQRKKDLSLIGRIHPGIKLLALKALKYEGEGPLAFALAPYVITQRLDGVTDAKLDIAIPCHYMSLAEWREQLVELYPAITLNDVIRSVADQDGGAHFDDNESSNLTILKGHNPTKIGSNILFVIALAHYVIEFANEIVPIWARNGKVCV